MQERCQFHQHFTQAFFVQKCFAQLFSSYILALAKGFQEKKHFRTKMCAYNVDEIEQRKAIAWKFFPTNFDAPLVSKQMVTQRRRR